MKTKSLVIIAGMLAFAGVSYAEEEKKEKKPKKEVSPELLEKYDADKDGKLSKEELAVMKKDKAEAKKAKEPKEPKAEKIEEKEAE
jgi:Ca2+-binding EF-hand superfamily protein